MGVIRSTWSEKDRNLYSLDTYLSAHAFSNEIKLDLIPTLAGMTK
jgi:hypothetical protein